MRVVLLNGSQIYAEVDVDPRKTQSRFVDGRLEGRSIRPDNGERYLLWDIKERDGSYVTSSYSRLSQSLAAGRAGE